MKVNGILRRTALALLLSLTGCTTMSRAEAPSGTVTLTESGRLYVGQTHTGLAGMARKLRTDGCTRQSRITVEIPHDTSPAVMQEISRHLASGGFHRFIFVKPRRAVSEVGEDPMVNRFREARGEP